MEAASCSGSQHITKRSLPIILYYLLGTTPMYFRKLCHPAFGVQWLLISVVHGDLIVPCICTSTMQYRASSNLLERSSIGTRVSPNNKFLGPFSAALKSVLFSHD